MNYDGNGNLNSFSTTSNSFSRTLAYDQANRLSSFAATGSPSSQSYSYLPNGLRITRPELSGPVFSYLYDGTSVIGSTLSSVSDGTPEAGLYLWGPTGVAMCYVPDPNNLSSAAYAYDPSGNRVATPGSTSHNGITGCFNIWDAYGDIYTSTYNDPSTVTGHDIIDQIAYKGQDGCIDDWDTSLIYCQNRYYATEFGRWLTPDPIGLEGGLNVYSFCGNNPLMFSDPQGTDLHIAGDTDGAGTFAFLWHGRADMLRPTRLEAMFKMMYTRETRVLLFGHASPGNFPLGGTDDGSFTVDDIEYMAQYRKAIGLPKLKLFEVDACMVMADHNFVNAALDLADEVKGYRGWTVNPEFPGAPGILWSFTHKLPPNVIEPDSDRNYAYGSKPATSAKKHKKKVRNGIE